MKRFFGFSFFVLLFFLTWGQLPQKPNPPRLVNDFAEIFTYQELAVLEAQLLAFSDSTSNQITVVTIPDLGGKTPVEFATELGVTWGVGNEKFDNGVVLLIKPKTQTKGEVFIAVGSGLEGVLPDITCKKIIEQELIPNFRNNAYFAGVEDAIQVICPILAGEYSYADYKKKTSFFPIVIAILFFIIFLLPFLLKSKSTTMTKEGVKGIDPMTAILLGGMFGHSHRGHHGGGGFSGGGFGGFGGGGFGGGGAGGSW